MFKHEDVISLSTDYKYWCYFIKTYSSECQIYGWHPFNQIYHLSQSFFFFVPEFGFNLFSISDFLNHNKDYFAYFSHDQFTIQRNNKVIMVNKGNKPRGLYILDNKEPTHKIYINNALAKIWHHYLGHPHLKRWPF